MVGGLSLVAAPLAAAAHTGNLFTWVYYPGGNDELAGFATLSQTDASLAVLPAPGVDDLYGYGADICSDESSWGVGQVIEDMAVYTWNHDTGAVGPRVIAQASVADFPEAESVQVNDIWAADSLAGCVKLAFVAYYVYYEEGDPEYRVTLSYVDVGTGDVHPIVELAQTNGQNSIEWDGIATDPLTGYTHLFATYLNAPYFTGVDLGAGEVGELREMEGTDDLFEGGSPGEGDYQPDGKLWLYYSAGDSVYLLSFPAGSDLTTVEPTNVGPVQQGDVHLHNIDTLTYDPKALPATGGGVPVGVLLVGGALFAGGVVLLGVRRTARVSR